jgi:hypothetical protein
MAKLFFRRLALALAHLSQAILSTSASVRAEPGDAPAISPPAVQGAVEPQITQQGAAGLPPAERYHPDKPVRVMPDLRLDEPGVSPPVSPQVQERDLREAPRVSPPDPTRPPRVREDLRESPPVPPPGPEVEQRKDGQP